MRVRKGGFTLTSSTAQAFIDVVPPHANTPVHREGRRISWRHVPGDVAQRSKAQIHLHLVRCYEAVERVLPLRREPELGAQRPGDRERVVAEGPRHGRHLLHRAHLEVEGEKVGMRGIGMFGGDAYLRPHVLAVTRLQADCDSDSAARVFKLRERFERRRALKEVPGARDQRYGSRVGSAIVEAATRRKAVQETNACAQYGGPRTPGSPCRQEGVFPWMPWHSQGQGQGQGRGQGSPRRGYSHRLDLANGSQDRLHFPSLREGKWSSLRFAERAPRVNFPP
jgi:hypothetical protein